MERKKKATMKKNEIDDGIWQKRWTKMNCDVCGKEVVCNCHKNIQMIKRERNEEYLEEEEEEFNQNI